MRISKKQVQKIFDMNSLGKVKTKKIIAEGVSNPAYLINDKFILRIKKDSKEHKFQKEKFLFYFLGKKTDLPFPEVITLDYSKKIIDYDYMVLKKLPGASLEKTFPSLSKEKKKKLAYQLGEALAKIHSIHFNRIGHFVPDKIKEKRSWKNLILDIYYESIKSIKKTSFLSKSTLQKIDQFIEKNEKLLNTRFKPSLIHSDYNFENILIKNGKISGILDLEWSHSGDPEYELSTINMKLFKLIKSPYRHHFFKGYESKFKRRKIPKNLEKLYRIVYWLGILAWIHEEIAPTDSKKYIKSIMEQLQ
jgi:aminoglycoside phosphotransferase (APT) family kinase protein